VCTFRRFRRVRWLTHPRFEYESTIYHLSNAHRWPPSRPHLPVSRRNGCPTEFELYLKNDTLDVVLGTSEWRGKIIEELKKYPTLMETSKCPGATRIVFEAFKGQLTKLGYPHIAAGDEIRFKNSKRAQLYYLITSFSRRDIKRGMNFGKRFKLSTLVASARCLHEQLGCEDHQHRSGYVQNPVVTKFACPQFCNS